MRNTFSARWIYLYESCEPLFRITLHQHILLKFLFETKLESEP